VKKFFLNLLSLLSTLLLIVLFTEIAVRIFVDDGFNYELEMMKYAKELKITKRVEGVDTFIHKPNIETTIMKAKIKTDSNGFRDNQIQNDISNRLMLLGDSMTFGFGSNFTFSDYLQKEFINEFKIINAGVGNTNTVMQEKSFFEFYKKHSPNVLVLNFVINDLELIIPKKKNFIRNNFYSYSYFNYKISLIKMNFNDVSYVTYYKNQFKNKIALDKFRNSVLNLKYYSLKNNIKFFVHFVPELNNVNDYPFVDEVDTIKEFLNLNDIKFIDGLKYFKGNKENTLWVNEFDKHANEKAHKIIGKYLSKYLKGQI